MESGILLFANLHGYIAAQFHQNVELRVKIRNSYVNFNLRGFCVSKLP